MADGNISNVNPDFGLTDAQVQAQIKSGHKNTAEQSLTRSVREILRDNIFTLFNLINVVLGALVFYTGSYKNLLFLGIAFFNTAIGIIQEIRSKRQVDKMVLLAEGKINVVRNGEDVQLRPEDIVLGDIIQLGRGDQIPVDGEVVRSRGIEVDESPITGESSTISKAIGDPLTSGTYLIGGSGKMLVTKVGADTFVNHLSNEAKQGKDTSSILLNTINRIIKVLTYVIIPLGIILFVAKLYGGTGINRAILGSAAAMIGMIPEGLVLLTSMTLAVSAMHLARKKTLVRDLPAIETLARVDVICLDKTGTITSGDLKFVKAIPMMKDVPAAEVEKVVAGITYGTGDGNETANAIKDAIDDPQLKTEKIIPFSSERKWSGVGFSDGHDYVFGAPQFIFKELSPSVRAQITQNAELGYRVLAVAQVDNLDPRKPLNSPKLIGLILISDVIRPNAANTFQYFHNQDVDIKVISGDDPTTVSTIATQAGINRAQNSIDMTTVQDDDDFGEIAAQNTVFGRVTPDQKKRLISGLQERKHTVAMTGDGVNDLLALRQADCGIAMASGSESTKSIADFVLINSNFDAMIDVLKEGRRVINNIERVASMYLIKTMYSVALSFIFVFFAMGYPFEPIQLTPITSLMVGIPSFFLALEPNFNKITNQFMKQVLVISTPAAVCIVGYIMIIEVIGLVFGLKYEFTSTLCVLLTGAICWLALLMVSRPMNRLKIGMDVLVLAAFLLIIIFFNNVFSLVSFFNKDIWLYAVPLIATAYPLYIFMQGVIARVLDRREKKRQASVK
ncbi:putative cation-transporting ATPase F [Lentilactobacillus parabuchneri]|jgi:cation-transporting ATPase E|uniref:P-type (Transporting) HAD superfamily ATPase n=4 Tax=Lentilactobacillus parabuchneri TaxID=152331 RepID=A0A0R1Z1W8_9LACO|nr:cation-translocating P-type ATPase [Lentilactobacillus parabuchneri]APR07436.1 putative cation-transporting ATPase F [Lentilactobacillus parabuchneri]KRM45609.1 P-type (transporting) HAD superfamily ATPase [Lentilactobacillus parabuchneri DSM 5707 = NBRC 107865]KRN80629.1 P-type (transporting) HAD superfamily ATPase [Lentilactobacillus parabuchneri]MBW0223797.1 cation-translocating P-type ATPase [Lentilactobacillus parabuchneri]MBW0246564.1 cation-translocating P-type ATPase [Lentilactobaci